MIWKLSCEQKDNLPLPPDYTFPRSFNYLNEKSNSFYILENESGYIQCGGSKERCTVELREYESDDSFRHYVFYDPSGSEKEAHIPMSDGGVNRKEKHCLHFRRAIELFTCYFEGKDWPDEFALEDITGQFK